MCGRSENVRKCPSELGICSRFPRCFNHISYFLFSGRRRQRIRLCLLLYFSVRFYQQFFRIPVVLPDPRADSGAAAGDQMMPMMKTMTIRMGSTHVM